MTQHRKVLIVGATGRAAAFSARRAGLWPSVADRFADEDLLALCPAERITDLPAGLAAWLERAPQTGWIFTGPLENHPEWVDRLSRLRPLWGNRGAVLRRVRDPSRLAAALAAGGAPTLEVELELRRVPRDGSWLCKPLCSAGGGGIELVESGFQVPARDVYYQRRAIGQDISGCYLAARGEAVLLGLTRQFVGSAWAGAGGYQYVGSLGPYPATPRVWAAAAALGRLLAAAFGLTGLFGVDAVLQGNELYCLEVNPRYTAAVEVVERAYQLSSLQWHVEACCSGVLPQPACRQEGVQLAGKAVVYARREVRSTPALRAWAAGLSSGTTWPAVADIPAAGTRFQAGQPIATVLAAGNDGAEVEAQLKQRIAELELHLVDCCHTAPAASVPRSPGNRT